MIVLALLCPLTAIEELACDLNLPNLVPGLDCDCDASVHSADCNDYDDTIYPGATEIPGNNVDNNCNGGEVCYADADNDSYRPNSSSTVTSSDADCTDANEAVSTDLTTDCNDGNVGIHPGANETTADGVDQDCNGGEVCYADADNDSYRPNSSSTVSSADLDCTDSGEAPSTDPTTDCNDSSSTVNPGATEVIADGVDENCNGGETCYVDADNDNYRPNATSTVSSADLDCVDSGEAVSTDGTGDCADGDAGINPGATEIPGNGVDNDCSGGEICYLDADNDSYRPNGSATLTSADTDCSDSGEAVGADPVSDCNDAAASVHPGASETCNAVDDDCDSSVDEGFEAYFESWYLDMDGDSYGDEEEFLSYGCVEPPDGVPNADDCDDDDDTSHPGATEVCDYADNDCDGLVDDGLDLTTYYYDGDGDGYGSMNPNDADQFCAQPPGYAEHANDCDDTNPFRNYIDPYNPPFCQQ